MERRFIAFLMAVVLLLGAIPQGMGLPALAAETDTTCADGHDFVNAGVSTIKCADCGYTIRCNGCYSLFDDAYEVIETEATCTASGTSLGWRCDGCDSWILEETRLIPPTGHSYANGSCTTCGAACSHRWILDEDLSYEATCTADGLQVFDCFLCDLSRQETVLTTGHLLLEDDFGYVSCASCNKDYVACPNNACVIIGAAYFQDYCAPTCTEAGSSSGLFCLCGACYEEGPIIFPATGHTFSGNTCTVCNITCTHDWVEGCCTLCGNPCEHSWVTDKELTSEAVCTEGGAVIQVCTLCNSAKKKTVAAGHSVTDGVCTVCGKAVSGGEESCAHNMVLDEENSVAASCSEGGVQVYVCSECGLTTQEAVAAIGHNYALAATVPPTCGDYGHYWYECKNCADRYMEYDYGWPPTQAHTWDSGVCTSCWFMCPHNSGTMDNERSVAPTCTEPGYEYFVCDCGESTHTYEISPLGHSYTDGVCTRCGAWEIYSGTWGSNITWTLDPATGLMTVSGSGDIGYSVEEAYSWTAYKDLIVTLEIGEGITGIGADAFQSCASLTSVTIPGSVKVIEEMAFYNCQALTTLNLSEGLTIIGMQAFSGSKITELSLPDSLTLVETMAFYSCEELTKVTIGSGLTTISSSMFGLCTKLASVTIPNGVTTIGMNAFSQCQSLTNVTIPGSVTEICSGAFDDCYHLTDVHFLGDMPTIASDAFEKSSNTSSLALEKSSSIPAVASTASEGNDYIATFYIMEDAEGWADCEFTTQIWDYNATYTCYSVTYTCNTCGGSYVDDYEGDHNWEYDQEASTPASCQSSGRAVYVCTFCGAAYEEAEDILPHSYVDGFCTACGAQEIYSGTCGESLTWVLDPNVKTLTISGSGTMSDYSSASASRAPWYAYRSSIHTVVIGDGVTSIGSYAFYYCTGLTTIIIPDSVRTINSSAFFRCTGLTAVYITDLAAWCSIDFRASNSNPLSYGAGLYLNEELVTNLAIPDGVTAIKKYAFYGYTRLTAVTIGNNVTAIGSNAFSGCTGLATVTFSSCLTDIGTWAFSDCSKLDNIVIPDSVTTIGAYAFDECTGMTSVTIGNGVTTIGGGAFLDCTGLTAVTIPSSVTSIGLQAFCACDSLTKIVVSEENTAYASDALGLLYSKDMTTLIQCPGAFTGSYTVPDGVTTIDHHAFGYCSDLTTVTIPDSVTSMGDAAFYSCTGLTSVTLGEGVTGIGMLAFYNCTGLIAVAIPNSVTSIRDSAFDGCTALTTVTIGNGVTTIGGNSFIRCSSLCHVHFLGDMPSMGTSAFDSRSSDLKLCYIEGKQGWEDCTYTTEVWDYSYTTNCESFIYACNSCGGGYSGTNEGTHCWVLDDSKTVLPTCTQEGSMTYYCSACSAEKEEALSATGHSLVYSDNGDDHIVACESCDFLEAEAHSYTDGGCICGAVGAISPTEVEVKIGHAVGFDSDLKMNYRIKYTDIAKEITDYVTVGAYLVVEKTCYPSGRSTTVETVTLYPDLTSDPDRMLFSLGNIQSVEMGSELSAELHIFDAQGNEYITPVDAYSVVDYVELCFSTYSYDTMPELYTMLIDALNYGSAAQLYFGRRTDVLANAGMDAYQQYATTALSEELTDSRTYVDNDREITAVTAMGFSVNFSDKTEVNVKLTLADGYSKEDITYVKVLDSNGNVVDTLTDFTELSDGRLQVTYYGVKSIQMREMFQFVAYVSDKVASQNVGYSVEAYAKSNVSSSNANLAEMALKCMYYGDAAYAYFNR